MTDGREMTCQEFVELVTDYLEDRMAPADRARFEEHLAICGGCQAYIEQIQGTLRALGRLPREEVAAGVRDDILSAFRDWHTGR
jgi:predicted anti-sigma-YlaC factor YlaD